MPPALHPHLKRGLDFAPVLVEPQDAIEALPSRPSDAQEHEAKRRRVEAIATHYLRRGRLPLILSARLRGPFDHGWHNPWAAAATRPSRPSPNKSRAAVAGAGHARPSRRKTSQPRTEGQVASPETSRATTDTLSFRAHDHGLHPVDVEMPAATAPSPAQDDASGTTEFFSANTERIIQTRSPLTNPFWLRRPESERRGGVHFSQKGNPEVSPTRSRSVRSRGAVAERHKTMPVETPRRAQSASERTPLSGNWRSSASASMVVSSPAHGPRALQNQDTAGAQSSVEVPIPSIISNNNPQTVMAPTHTPYSTESGRPAQPSGVHERSITKDSQGHAEVHVPSSTEELIPLMPPPSASTRPSARKHVTRGAVRHDRVASPAPASSTGFIYRKISDPRCRKGEVQKHKARAVDFDSPPATKKAASDPLNQEAQAGGDIKNDAIPVQTTPEEHGSNPEIAQDDPEEPVLADDTIAELQLPEQDSGRSSHQSAMSTQAAMLLAQLEFQESTYRSLSPLDTQKWSQASDNTPRSLLHVPSPAITPLSVFSTRLDNVFSNDSVLRGPPISTQDLFGAASPFAFSTIKKKPTAPPQSGLRFGLPIPHDDDLEAESATAKSPIPSAERIPLKAKGNTPSLWSFANEKYSQASQESLVDRSRRSVHDVELPQLDFHTSLDDFETNGGLHFTDRFLHNLHTT